MEKRDLLYSGKAKSVYTTDDADKVIIHYNDDATAGNGAKHAIIENKGVLNNQITTLIFEALKSAGVPTHHIQTLNDREQLCQKVTIIPLEVITRNTIAGSMAARLGIEEGTRPENVIYELCYKNDALGDPLINDDHAVALGIASYEELATIYDLTDAINETLDTLFSEIGIDLVDFKIEFGKTSSGEIILADEISPDTSRLWDSKSGEKLDKDRFRRDLGGLTNAYEVVLERLKAFSKRSSS
ncbi:phosphoribosylaminoimidazolesuccinocarboxamide synthase [Suttonella ornithocola]|uniref:Phosphoribosylaminoimidazole-succinocarboxamide synthase n=1 Tax=Suttonella ornithocola TaxID=279832 RepID=A0A380MXU9_9GAMM|nr:phosphoribosylaminoimidazolesuccinocarboxamide synthase [Suttonella ornithocola]SUO96866.1 Phosphoribosylaminoimidazole-succinocarboxamide synthase [Suttonella ornithocola]